VGLKVGYELLVGKAVIVGYGLTVEDEKCVGANVCLLPRIDPPPKSILPVLAFDTVGMGVDGKKDAGGMVMACTVLAATVENTVVGASEGGTDGITDGVSEGTSEPMVDDGVLLGALVTGS
jgi:hypothetical protein